MHLSGFDVIGALPTFYSEHITDDLNTFDPHEIVGWPFYITHPQVVHRVTLTTNYPVQSTQKRALNGFAATSFVDDFYYRVHVSPAVLDLGNVVSTQTTPVYVWNAHFVAQTLADIDGTDEGLIVSGHPSPPLLFGPLQEREYQLAVTPAGQPVLDTTVAWVFNNGETPDVRVTANRIIAFTFMPDWSEGVIERLVFLTDVMASESWAEQRRALRTAPRRELAAPVLVEGRERQLLDMTLYGWGSRIFAIPVWPDIQRLTSTVVDDSLRIDCETDYLDFRVNGLAVLLGETAFQIEVVEIESIDSTGLNLKRATQQNWPAGTRLYPGRTARMNRQPELSRLTDMADKLNVEFMVMEVCDWPELTDLPMYRGWLVLEARPNETENLTRQFENLLSTLDSELAIPLFSDLAGKTMPVTGWTWLDEGRANRAWLRSLMYTLRGKQAAIWVPTHADDLTLVAILSANVSAMDVANIGYSRFSQSRVGRRDIRIELRTGEVFYRRILGSTEIDAETERLSLDSVLGVTVLPADVKRICWVVLSRSTSDSFTIEHVTDSQGAAKSALQFIGVRDDDL